ncbi:MAG: thrombospondin type 3 repeat-containing protein [Deltaproteobacteria bacterium]|nr:thrombospondin type 3 repeat-containing protein [Deltaproteobacteria bacterium]
MAGLETPATPALGWTIRGLEVFMQSRVVGSMLVAVLAGTTLPSTAHGADPLMVKEILAAGMSTAQELTNAYLTFDSDPAAGVLSIVYVSDQVYYYAPYASAKPMVLRGISDPVIIPGGNVIGIRYEDDAGIDSLNICLPEGALDVLYVADDGSTYFDGALTDLARACPTTTVQPLMVQDVVLGSLSYSEPGQNRYMFFNGYHSGNEDATKALYQIYSEEWGQVGFDKLAFAEPQPLVLHGAPEPFAALMPEGGNTLTMIFSDGGPDQLIHICLPGGPVTKVYVAADGSTYHDILLTELAAVCPVSTIAPLMVKDVIEVSEETPQPASSYMFFNGYTSWNAIAAESMYQFYTGGPGYDNQVLTVAEPLAIKGIQGPQLPNTMSGGNNFVVEYDDGGGAKTIDVCLPAGPLAKLYVAEDGSTYFDARLTDLAQPCDADNDGIINSSDNCPDLHNPDQLDAEGDGLGDICDSDDDNDVVDDVDDNCPFVVNLDQADNDEDDEGDVCDDDDDNDGTADVADCAPFDDSIDDSGSRPAGNVVGLCRDNEEACTDGVWADDDSNHIPEEEVCDGEDNNCNGLVDEGYGIGISCISDANSCGDNTDGAFTCAIGGFAECSAVTPTERTGYDEACVSDANQCGDTSPGVSVCAEVGVDCTASLPADRFGYGDACSSPPNNCGDTNAGVNVCALADLGVECSEEAPDDRPGVGDPCVSDENQCGDTSSGEFECAHVGVECNAPVPTDRLGYAVPCSSPPNNCGDTNTGYNRCAPTGLGVECDAETPDDMPQATAYLDLDGDGNGDANAPVDATCGVPVGALLETAEADGSCGCGSTGNPGYNPGLFVLALAFMRRRRGGLMNAPDGMRGRPGRPPERQRQ